MLSTRVEGGEPFAVNTQGDREGVLAPLSRVRERHIVSRSQSRHGIAECLPLAGCVREWRRVPEAARVEAKGPSGWKRWR